MGAGDKTITLTLQTIADVKQAEGQLKQLREIIQTMKPEGRLADGFKTAFDKAEQYAQKASSVINKGFKDRKDIAAFEKAMEGLGKEYHNLIGYMGRLNKENFKNALSKDQIAQFNQLTQSLKQAEEAMANFKYGKMKEKLDSLNFVTKEVEKTYKRFGNAINANDFDRARNAISDLVIQQKTYQQQVKELTATKQELEQADKTETEEFKRNSEALAEREQKLKDVTTAINMFRQILGIATRGFQEQGQEVQNATKLLQDFIVTALNPVEQSMKGVTNSVDQSRQALNGYTAEAVAAGEESVKFGQELDQFKNRIGYFFGINNAIRLVRRAITSAYQTIKELDKAMTETAVVTNFSVGDMWSKLPEYTERANKLGVTIKDVYESATLYYQQGLKTNEVMAVSNATLKMARIAGLEAAEATDRMTNALRGFNMEINENNADKVADVYSKLAAMSASNVDEISTAMTKVASLAHNANMQFETTSAFLAQIIETTRESAETAGTALKTVVARFSEVKQLFSEGELLGTDEEGEAIDVNKVSKALRTAGIDLNEYLTGMKGLDDIFMELASKWDSLDRVQQRYIATMAAGSRQQSRFIAMMQDYKRTTELVSAAQNAAGASQEQYQKTLESLETKLNRLKNSWNTFLMGILNSDVIKFVVDTLRTLFDVVNKVTGIFSTLLPNAIGNLATSIAKLAVAVTLFKFGGSLIQKKVLPGLLKGIRQLGTAGKAAAAKEGTEIGTTMAASMSAGVAEGSTAAVGATTALTGAFTGLGTASARLEAALYGVGGAMGFEAISAEDSLWINTLTDAELKQQIPLMGTKNTQAYLAAIAAKDEAAATKILNEELARENALQKGGLKGLLTRIGLAVMGVDVTTAEAAAKGASATATTGQTVAEKGLNVERDKAIVKQAVLNKAMLVGIGIFAAVAIAIGAIIWALTRAEQKVKRTEKALEEASEKAAEASDAYKDVRDSLEELSHQKETLDAMTKGTQEWNEAVVELNSQILALLDKYPDLAAALTVDENGVMYFDPDKQQEIIDKKREDMVEAQYTKAKAQVDVRDAKNAKAERDARRGLQWGVVDESGTRLLSDQIDALLKLEGIAVSTNDVRNIVGDNFSEQTLKNIRDIINTMKNSQQTEGIKTESAIKSTLATVLGNQDYGKNTDLVKSLITTDTISKYDTAEGLQSGINNALAKMTTEQEELTQRVLSGELQEGDYTSFEGDKELQKVLEDLGINITELNNSIKGLDEGMTARKEQMQQYGSWAVEAGAGTQENIIEKVGDSKNLAGSISRIVDGMSDKDRQTFIKALFSEDFDWSNLDQIDNFKNQLQALGITVKDTDLNPLLNEIAKLNQAASASATVTNLSAKMQSQNDVIQTVAEGNALSPEQKGVAVSAGIPTDAFIPTPDGWIYTGDINELASKFNTANANMYQKALTSFKNNPNEANRENVNQMAQLMGASGESYMRAGMDQEALNNYTKGAEAMLQLSDNGQKYLDKAKAIEKENKTLADSYVRSANAATKMIPKYQELTDVINDNVEALEKEDPDALAKVAKAAKSAFGQEFTTKQIAAAKQEFIDFANGVEGSWDKLSDKLISLNANSFDNLSTNMQNVQVEGKNLSDYLQGLNWDTEGQAKLDDSALLASLANDQVAAQQLEAALKAAGIAMDFEWADEWIEVPVAEATGKLSARGIEGSINTVKKRIRVPKAVTLTNGLKEQQRINGGGGGKSGGGGGSDKQKYWDNPYDELYNLLEDQNEALRTREKLEREYDRILKRRASTAQELKQNSLDEIANLQRELDIQRQIQAGRSRMINELAQQTHRDEEGNERTFANWGVTKYGWYDEQNGVMRIDWNAIDQVNDPELGGAIEAYISKLEELSESFEETQTTIEEMEDLIREIKERNMQEYLEFEERVYQAIIDREQKIIDDYSALAETIDEANSNILSSLRESIDLERQIRDNTKTEEDIADKEARLAYLQRDTSGANQTEILKLQQELDDARQSYGDTLVDQAIDQLENDNQKAADQRQQQIEIMQAQLDYFNKEGAFWEEAYKLINESFDENGSLNTDSELVGLLQEADVFRGLSEFGKMDWIKQLIEEWLKAQEGLANWRNEHAEEIYNSANNMLELTGKNGAASIWYNGTNWVDASGNTYTGVHWDEQSGQYTYDSITTPTTPTTQPTTPQEPAAPTTSARGKLASLGNDTKGKVLTLQQGLNDLIKDGILTGVAPLKEDGVYGKYTTAAVKKFQQLIGAYVDGIWGSNTNRFFQQSGYTQYKTGGLVSSTGLAWLDGTKSNPEMVLSARDTENFIALRNALSQMLAQGGGKGGDNYFNIEINVDELANDYDVDQLADRIKKQIYDDSSYRNVNAISYLR